MLGTKYPIFIFIDVAIHLSYRPLFCQGVKSAIKRGRQGDDSGLLA